MGDVSPTKQEIAKMRRAVATCCVDNMLLPVKSIDVIQLGVAGANHPSVAICDDERGPQFRRSVGLSGAVSGALGIEIDQMQETVLHVRGVRRSGIPGARHA